MVLHKGVYRITDQSHFNAAPGVSRKDRCVKSSAFPFWCCCSTRFSSPGHPKMKNAAPAGAHGAWRAPIPSLFHPPRPTDTRPMNASSSRRSPIPLNPCVTISGCWAAGDGHRGMRGQAGVRHHRDAAPHRGEIPPRGQRRRRQLLSASIAGQRPELGGAPSATSCTCPTSPRTAIRTPPARPRPRRPGAVARQPARDRRRCHGVGARIRRLLAEACVMPVLTAHPTAKCSARHAGRTPRDRPGAGPPRRHAHARGAGRDRRHAAGPRGHAVADPHAALHPSDGGRRDRERAVVLPQHLPAGDSAPVRRPVAPLEPRSAKFAAPPRRWNRSCAWAAGSAATATAIPTSTPARWNARCCARPRCCSNTICRRSTRWARTCP